MHDSTHAARHSRTTTQILGRLNQVRFLIATVLIATLCACSGTGGGLMTAPPPEPRAGWMADGAITLARSAPPAQLVGQATMLGFLPGTIPAAIPAIAAPAERVGPWISIDRSSQKLTLFNGAAVVGSFSGEGFDRLTTGSFRLTLKQRNPLWYAPDSYFTSRNIEVPAPGDRARFRRGALGDFAVFLDRTTALHSGPVWSTDIGGLRLEENDLSRIYYQLEIGSYVEIR